ncbi:hypothetical protein FOCC_FOCC006658 [Frankliniella occidentalis]|uniref:Cyclin-Q n=1 Tax=Frankliniella occidentalis TaxID=133901 RepID=A0A6J1TBR7_FRAOC|nr:cyclin-Q [Frankliniella occidentalis]KAE8746674.1 hypothetical protein FOCC_FOCC006658 [Frankliniella occidentalis]
MLSRGSMKDVIDVMQLQQSKGREFPPVKYKDRINNFTGARFIFECGLKLNAQPLTIASAAVLFHRFFREADMNLYDPYLFGATALYLAGKSKDDPLKLRDVMNVSHNTLNRNAPPLELNSDYWNLRDSIVQAELLLMRMLRFEVTPEYPHKYMFHYLKSLQGWFEADQWRRIPLAKASIAFLQDFHLDSAVLDYSPQHVALACIGLALQCYGVTVPLTNECDGPFWYSVFAEDLNKDKMWEIMEKIMAVYDKETEVPT